MPPQESLRPGRGAPGGPPDRYVLLFVLLILAFVLSAFATSEAARLPVVVIYAVALLLALRSARVTGPIASAVRAALAIGSLAAAVAVLVGPPGATQGPVACWVAIVLLATIVVLVRRVLHHRAVTLQTVFGALSAYLLIGFFFTAADTAVASFGPAPFFAGKQVVTSANLQYFSFVTLSTTGYGDFTALGAAGRSLAVLEALLGQIFLVTLVARLVSVLGTVRPDPAQHEQLTRPGPGDAPGT